MPRHALAAERAHRAVRRRDVTLREVDGTAGTWRSVSRQEPSVWRARSAWRRRAAARPPGGHGRPRPRSIQDRRPRAASSSASSPPPTPPSAPLPARRPTSSASRCSPSCMEVVDPDPGVSVRESVAALERSDDVAYAEPDVRRTAFAAPNDPSFSLLWGLRNTGQTVGGTPGTPDADIDADLAWDTTVGSRDVVVGVVDRPAPAACRTRSRPTATPRRTARAS